MTHYEKHMQKMRDKFGLDRLETEPEKRTIELPAGDTKPSQADLDYVPSLKRKYNMPHGFEVDGIPRQQTQSVADFVIDKEREAMKGMKLAVGSTTYKGKLMRIWYNIDTIR
jgi:hypothetical protein